MTLSWEERQALKERELRATPTSVLIDRIVSYAIERHESHNHNAGDAWDNGARDAERELDRRLPPEKI